MRCRCTIGNRSPSVRVPSSKQRDHPYLDQHLWTKAILIHTSAGWFVIEVVYNNYGNTVVVYRRVLHHLLALK